jgi:hypothetical protein
MDLREKLMNHLAGDEFVDETGDYKYYYKGHGWI